MSYFIFNDINSADLDLIITKPVIRPTWSEVINETAIPGRAATHRRYTGMYGDSRIHIQTALMDATPEKVKAVYQKLKGEGILVLSGNTSEYMNVRIDTLVPEAVALMAAEIPLSVIAYPFAYAVEPTIKDFTANIYISDQEQLPTTIYNNESIYWEPVIEYKLATAETEVAFDVGGSWFHVKTPDVIKAALDPSAYTIVIDSENRICYYVRPDGVKVSCTQNTSGSFPRLRVGASELMHTKTLLSAVINEKERWL